MIRISLCKGRQMVIRHKDPQIGLLNLRLMDDILFDFRVGARTLKRAGPFVRLTLKQRSRLRYYYFWEFRILGWYFNFWIFTFFEILDSIQQIILTTTSTIVGAIIWHLEVNNLVGYSHKSFHKICEDFHLNFLTHLYVIQWAKEVNTHFVSPKNISAHSLKSNNPRHQLTNQP